jgi:nicotinamidase-related amidase
MEINKSDTAVLVTDAQNDFLSEQGVATIIHNLDFLQACTRLRIVSVSMSL